MGGITLGSWLYDVMHNEDEDWDNEDWDDVYSDPYRGYDPYDEKDAEDMANNPTGNETCAEIQEAIVAIQNSIRGREQNCEEHYGGDRGHREKIENLRDALRKLQQMLASCNG
jgi:hypothetical protein